MTWTYSGSPAGSQRDEVRFLVGDTDDQDPLVTDEEIDYALATWLPVYGTTHWVAASVAENVAARLTRETTYSADGVSISLGDLQRKFVELAKQLRTQHYSLLVGGTPDVGGVDPYEQPDPFLKNLDFGTGMHDNIDAGRQNYGERDNATYDPYSNPGT